MKLFTQGLACVLIARSLVFAQDWEFIGFEIESISAIAIDPSNSEVLYVGSSSDFSAGRQGGIFKSMNTGASWDTLLRGLSVSDIVIHPSGSDTLFVASGIRNASPPGILKSSNGGESWAWSDSGIIVNWETGVLSLAIDPRQPEIMYAGTDGFFGGTIYKSTTGGRYWFQIDPDTPWVWTTDSILYDPLEAGITSIAIDPMDTRIIYAGTSSIGVIVKTQDGGTTWQMTGLTGKSIVYDISVCTSSPETIYSATQRNGFYFSVNGGETWQEWNQGLPNPVNAHKIQVVDTPVGTEIFIAANLADSGGVYRCVIGQPWEKVGINGSRVNTITIFEEKLYAGARGIYVTDIVTSVANLASPPVSISLDQNYPNPFNPSTAIRYELPKQSYVVLKIFSLLGQEVATLVDEEKPAGRYEVKWDASRFSSGVYFYRLQAGEFVGVRRLILVR